MLSGEGLVHLVNVIAPLYFCIGLGYVAIKWKIISNDVVLPGISGFTSKFALPFLCFRLLATNNPYSMNMRLILADSMFKFAVLLFGALTCFHRNAPDYVAWINSLYNLATLPNSVLIGIPLVTSLYPGTESYISTLIFMQIAVWFTLCIVILEIYKVLSEALAVAVVFTTPGTEGKHRDAVMIEMEPSGCGISDGATKKEAPLTTPVTEHNGAVVAAVEELGPKEQPCGSKAMDMTVSKNQIHDEQHQADASASLKIMAKNANHEVVAGIVDGDRVGAPPSTNSSHDGFRAVRIATMGAPALGPTCTPTAQSSESERGHYVTIALDVVEGRNLNSSGAGGEADFGRRKSKKARNPALRIVATVGKRVINELKWSPVLWASFMGLVYALFSFKLHIGEPLPDMLDRITVMIGNCTLGLAMFMLGMRMGTSKKLFAGGVPLALMGAFIRFVIAPAGMALCSIAVGLRGNTFRFAVMQSMVPQAVVSFVFATQYQVHVDLFSTAVWFQTLIFLPFALALDALLSVNS